MTDMDAWNAGYEKGRDDYCCNHDCNQGRDCPLRKMNNEPVAWMTFDGEYSYELMLVKDNEDYRNEYIKRNGEKYKDWVQPLYTHPAKTLTDEEILESANKIHARIPKNIGNDFLLISFARAILRKAQEK